MQVGRIAQLTNNRILPVNTFSNRKHKFTLVTPECGDWEAWYLNRRLIAECHSVSVEDILDALTDIFPNDYERIEISDEKAEMGFEEDLDDMLKD